MILACKFMASLAALVASLTLAWIVLHGVTIRHHSPALSQTQVYLTEVHF